MLRIERLFSFCFFQILIALCELSFSSFDSRGRGRGDSGSNVIQINAEHLLYGIAVFTLFYPIFRVNLDNFFCYSLSRADPNNSMTKAEVFAIEIGSLDC